MRCQEGFYYRNFSDCALAVQLAHPEARRILLAGAAGAGIPGSFVMLWESGLGRSQGQAQ